MELRRRPARAQHGDEGFSLVEVMVSMTVMTVVMSAVTSFFVSSIRVNNVQAGKQLAARVAESALERVRSIDPARLLAGRTKAAVESSLTTVKALVPSVTGLLTSVAPVVAYDTTTDALTTAQKALLKPLLPVTPVPVSVGGSSYEQNFVIANCTQAVSGGACLPSPSAVLAVLPGVTTQAMFKVIVAVSWKDRSCGPAGTCSSAVSTLVGNVTQDPVFNNTAEMLPPVAVTPGARTGTVGTAASVQLTATTTTASPLIWGGYGGLPPGLTGDAGGLISGTPTTAGVYAVTATVRDQFFQTATVVFVFTVVPAVPPVAVTPPGAQTDTRGTAASLTLAATNGTLPYTWSATGLPAGLTLNTLTGKVTGTPTTVGASSVTVRATDVLGASATATFTWTIAPGITVTSPGAQTSRWGVYDSAALTASGGTGPYTWSATGLPLGMGINASTGQISGWPLFPGSYSTTAKATDANGVTGTVTFTWTVTL